MDKNWIGIGIKFDIENLRSYVQELSLIFATIVVTALPHVM